MDRYKEDYLQKCECLDCEKSFIVGVFLASQIEQKGNKIRCPYCGSEITEATVWSDEESHPEGLGCLAIMYQENR